MLPLYDKLYRVVINSRGASKNDTRDDTLSRVLNSCWEEIVSPFRNFKPDPEQREGLLIPGTRIYNVVKELGFSVPNTRGTGKESLTEDLKAIISASDWLNCQEEDAAYALEQAISSSNLAASDGVIMRVAIAKERLLLLHSVYLLTSGLTDRKIPVAKYYELALYSLEKIVNIATVLSSLGEPKQSSVSDAVTMALDIYLTSDEILYLSGIIFRLNNQLSSSELLNLVNQIHNTISKISDTKYPLASTRVNGVTSSSPVSAPTSLKQAYYIFVCAFLQHCIDSKEQGLENDISDNVFDTNSCLQMSGKLYVSPVFNKGIIVELKLSEALSLEPNERLFMRESQGLNYSQNATETRGNDTVNAMLSRTNMEASNVILNSGLDLVPGVIQQSKNVQDQIPARELLCKNGNFRHSLEYVKWNGVSKDDIETRGITRSVTANIINPEQNIMIVDELEAKNLLSNMSVDIRPLISIHKIITSNSAEKINAYELIPVSRYLAMLASGISQLTNGPSPDTKSPTRSNKYSVFGVAFGLDEFYNHFIRYELSDKRTRFMRDEEYGELQSSSMTMYHYISAKNVFFGSDGMGSVDPSVSCSIGGELCDVIYEILHEILFNIGGGSIVFSLAETEKRVVDKKRAQDLETAIEEMRDILNSDNVVYGHGNNQSILRTLNAMSSNIKETFVGTKASGIGLENESEEAQHYVYPFTIFNLYLTIICRNRWIRSRISSPTLCCLKNLEEAKRIHGANAIPNSTLLSVYLEFCTKKINSVPLYLSSINLIRTLYGSLQLSSSRLAKRILGNEQNKQFNTRQGKDDIYNVGNNGSGVFGSMADNNQLKRTKIHSFIELYSEVTLNNVLDIVDKFLRVEATEDFIGLQNGINDRYTNPNIYGNGRMQSQSGYLTQSGLSGSTLANQFVNANKFNPRMRNLDLDGLDMDVGNRGLSMRSRLLGVMGEIEDMDEDFLNRDDFMPVVILSIRFINTMIKNVLLSQKQHIRTKRRQSATIPLDVDKILKIVSKLQIFIEILHNNYPLPTDGNSFIGSGLTLSALSRQSANQLSYPSVTNKANINPVEIQLELINTLTKLLDNTLLDHPGISTMVRNRVEYEVNMTLLTTNFKSLLKLGAKHAKSVFRFFYAILRSSIYEESAKNTTNAFGTTSSNLSRLTVSSFSPTGSITPMYVSANTVISDVLRDVSDFLGDFYLESANIVGAAVSRNSSEYGLSGLNNLDSGVNGVISNGTSQASISEIGNGGSARIGTRGRIKYSTTSASQYTVIHIYLIKFMNKLYKLYASHRVNGVDVTSFRVTYTQILKNIYKQLLTDYFTFSTCRTSRFFTALCSSIHNYWQDKARDIEINQMNRINQINRINQLNAANQMSQANQISDLNTANAINTFNTVNAINNLTRSNTLFNPMFNQMTSGMMTPGFGMTNFGSGQPGIMQVQQGVFGIATGGANIITPNIVSGIGLGGIQPVTPVSVVGGTNALQNQIASQTIQYDPISGTGLTMDIAEIALPSINISSMLSNSSSFEEAAEAYANFGVKELFKFTVCEMEKVYYIHDEHVVNNNNGGVISFNNITNDSRNKAIGDMGINDGVFGSKIGKQKQGNSEEQNELLSLLMSTDVTLPLMYPIIIDDRLDEQEKNENLDSKISKASAITGNNSTRINKIDRFKAASCLPCNINSSSCTVPTVILISIFGLIPDTSLWLLKNDKSMNPTSDTNKGFILVASGLDAKNTERVAHFISDSLRISTVSNLAQLLKSAVSHSTNLNLITETLNSINDHIAQNNEIINSGYNAVGQTNALNALGVNKNTIMGNGINLGMNNGINNMGGIGVGMNNMQNQTTMNNLDTIGKLSQLNNNLNLITIESNAMNSALQNTNTNVMAINSISSAIALGSVVQFISRMVSDVVKSPLDLVGSYRSIGFITHDDILDGGVGTCPNNSLNPTYKSMHALKNLYDFYIGYSKLNLKNDNDESDIFEYDKTGRPVCVTDGKDCIVTCNVGLYKLKDVLDLTFAIMENSKLLENDYDNNKNNVDDNYYNDIDMKIYHRTVKMFKYCFGILSGITLFNSTNDVMEQMVAEDKYGIQRNRSNTAVSKKMLVDIVDDNLLKDNLFSLYKALAGLINIDTAKLREFNPSCFSDILYCSEYLLKLTNCKLLRMKAKGDTNTEIKNHFESIISDMLSYALSVYIYPSVLSPVINNKNLCSKLVEEFNKPHSVLRMTEIEENSDENDGNNDDKNNDNQVIDGNGGEISKQKLASIVAPLSGIISAFNPEFEGVEALDDRAPWIKDNQLVNDIVDKLQTKNVSFLSALYIKLIGVIFNDELYDFSLKIDANNINGINAGPSSNMGELPEFLEALRTGSDNVVINDSKVDMMELVRFSLRKSRKGYEEISIGLVNQYLNENYDYYPLFLKSRNYRLKCPIYTCLSGQNKNNDNDFNYLRLLSLIKMTNHRMRVVDSQKRGLSSWSMLTQIAFTTAIENSSSMSNSIANSVQSKLAIAVGALSLICLVVCPLEEESIAEDVVEASVSWIPKVLGQVNILISTIPPDKSGEDNVLIRRSSRELSLVLLQAFENLCKCIVRRNSVNSDCVCISSLFITISVLCQSVTQFCHISTSISRLILERVVETEFQHTVQNVVDVALLSLRVSGSVEVLSFLNNVILMYIILKRQYSLVGGESMILTMPIAMDQVNSIISKFLAVFHDLESSQTILSVPAITMASELLDLIIKFTHIGFSTVLVRLDDLYLLMELFRKHYKSSADFMNNINDFSPKNNGNNDNMTRSESEIAKSLVISSLMTNNNCNYGADFYENSSINNNIKYDVINMKILQVFQNIISSQFTKDVEGDNVSVAQLGTTVGNGIFGASEGRSSYIHPSNEQLTKHVLESSLFNKMFLYFNSTKIAQKSIKLIKVLEHVRSVELPVEGFKSIHAHIYLLLIQANSLLQIHRTMDATQLHIDADTDISFLLLGPHLASTVSKLVKHLAEVLPTTASVVIFSSANVSPVIPRLPVLKLIHTSISYLSLRTEAVFDDILGSYVTELERKVIMKETDMDNQPMKKVNTKRITISILYGLCFYILKEFQAQKNIDGDGISFLRDEIQLMSVILEKSCMIIHKKTLLYFQLKVDEIIRLHGIDTGTAPGPIGIEGTVGFSISKIVENPSIAGMLVEHKLIIFPSSVENIIVQLCDTIDAFRNSGCITDLTASLSSELRSLIITK